MSCTSITKTPEIMPSSSETSTRPHFWPYPVWQRDQSETRVNRGALSNFQCALQKRYIGTWLSYKGKKILFRNPISEMLTAPLSNWDLYCERTAQGWSTGLVLVRCQIVIRNILQLSRWMYLQELAVSRYCCSLSPGRIQFPVSFRNYRFK